jgi:small subunit ribosomal protein S1
MSKEILKPEQFAAVEPMTAEEELEQSPEVAEQLAELYAGSLESFKLDAILTGTVLETTSNGVIVDIQFKSNGLIPLHEFNKHELKSFTPGSPIEVVIEDLEGFEGDIILSYERAKAAKAWKEILRLHDNDEPVKGYVVNKVKGGLSVDIGIHAFLPGSQVDVQRVSDFDQFVGQIITAKILKVNQKRGNVIISRRKHLSEQLSETRKEILDKLDVSQVIQGTVKNITKYGVFIDIGGVDGLLHITDMTWGRISHPSEIVNLGDTVTVKVLSLDKANEKISLGMKQLGENPWEKLSEQVQIGSTIDGRISSITDYGLFVEIAPGVEGLVHISEISWTDRIADLHQHYSVGQNIKAVVVSLDKESRRMSLSIKQLQQNPWEAVASKFEAGQTITGSITNIKDFGVFVNLIPGVDGLIHISDLSWTEHIKHPSDIYTIGDQVQAVITDINPEDKKVSLSIKKLHENPWDRAEEQYPKGTEVDARIVKVTQDGAYAKLPLGIEGFIPSAEYGEKADQIAEDQTVSCRVMYVSQKDERLTLSCKPEQKKKPKAKTTSSSPSEKQTKKKATTAEATSTTKMKSPLQIELEKHAAKADADENTEE